MTYLKINKDYLDYDHYAYLHSFTMNNFVKNMMQHGKYKKALKIVRRGLLDTLKFSRELITQGNIRNHGVPYHYNRMPPQYYNRDTRKQFKRVLYKPVDPIIKEVNF